MIARVLVWCKAALIVAVACTALGVVTAVAGAFASGVTEAELLAENWIERSENGITTWSQTVQTPFDGQRAHWRIVSVLHINEPSGRVVYSIDGHSLHTWSGLDRREVVAGTDDTTLVLEPRPLSPITLPPDQLRVTIEMPATASSPYTASLRVGPAGMFNSRNPPTWIELAGLTLILAAASVGATYVFIRRWRTPSPLRTATINTTLLTVSFAGTLIALEITTRLFLVFPDSMATTRVSELWWARHWTPTNEAGYRDVSHPPERSDDKKILFVVGDSFAAGHGIAKFEDTFSQLLAQELGDTWDVVVLAKPGMSTRDELDALAECSLEPDAIVVAHVWNDVNSALLAHGIAIPGKPAMQPVLRPIISRSYFLDFVYWRVRGLRAPMTSYLELILSAYRNRTIWDTHTQDLSGFVDYAKQHSAPLIVAAFPALENVDASRITSAQPVQFFSAQGIPAIDFAEVFASQDPRALTVNRFDSHPNEAAHTRIAAEIWKELETILNVETGEVNR